jgi:isopenicillin N synthase-like dioxygenase
MSIVAIIEIDRDPAVVARELDEVCHEVGFLQIVGHGVDVRDADAAWRPAESFFALADEQKRLVAPPHPGYPFGWFPMAAEALTRSLGQASRPDLKETFNIGPVDPPRHVFFDDDEASIWSPNLWPDDVLPELRAAWTPYYRTMASLASRLLSLAAIGLGLPGDHFTPYLDRHTSSMRANHYPPVTGAPAAGQMRAGAHTDYGTLTILRQAGPGPGPHAGGLEVLGVDGTWVAVPPIDDAFVVNVGDLLARWTNDRWRSTMHRVANPSAAGPVHGTASRQSLPFFHNANWDCLVEALPTCLAPGARPKHGPVRAGPHLMAKFRATVTERSASRPG